MQTWILADAPASLSSGKNGGKRLGGSVCERIGTLFAIIGPSSVQHNGCWHGAMAPGHERCANLAKERYGVLCPIESQNVISAHKTWLSMYHNAIHHEEGATVEHVIPRI